MNTLLPILGAISGEAVISVLVWVVVVGIIFWLLWWLLGYVGLPEPFNKVARVILALAAVLMLINALLTLVDKPFIRW